MSSTMKHKQSKLDKWLDEWDAEIMLCACYVGVFIGARLTPIIIAIMK